MKTPNLIAAMTFAFVFAMARPVNPQIAGASGQSLTNGAAQEAFVLRMDGQSTAAAALLQRALEKDPKDGAAWFESARLGFFMGDFKAAAGAIEKASKLEPGKARYHYWNGVLAVYRGVDMHHRWWGAAGMPGAFRRARGHFEKCLELDANHHDARLFLIALYANNPRMLGGNADKAEAQVKILEGLDPIKGAKARCELLDKEHAAERIEIWRDVIAKHPGSAEAHLEYARVLQQQAQYADAVEHFNRAIELEPGRAEWLLQLARCQMMNDQAQLARETLERFLELQAPPRPQRAEALRMLVRILRAEGKETEANQMADEAKRLDPREKAPREVPDLFTAP